MSVQGEFGLQSFYTQSLYAKFYNHVEIFFFYINTQKKNTYIIIGQIDEQNTKIHREIPDGASGHQ